MIINQYPLSLNLVQKVNNAIQDHKISIEPLLYLLQIVLDLLTKGSSSSLNNLPQKRLISPRSAIKVAAITCVFPPGI